jgi:hypothetical protein
LPTADTLAQLLQAQSVEQITQILLGVYQTAGFPVQSWQPLGVEQTRVLAIATLIADASSTQIPAIAGGGLLDLAPNVPGWTTLLADNYNLTPNGAVSTQGNIVINIPSGTVNYTPSNLIVTFGATGNRYAALTSGTLSAGNNTLMVQAESPGSAYSDASNSGALTLVTPIPGAVITNPAAQFSAVAHIGSGTGSIVPSSSLSPPYPPHQVVINILTTATSGSTCSWSYSIDSGTAVIVTGASASNIGGTGINIALVDGTNTSFVTNDEYIFSTPGSWITQQGANGETDTALAQACRNKWASLTYIPSTFLYQLLATRTPGVGAQVTQVIVSTDPIVNNKVNIIIAGPAGVLPPAVIALVQAFISPAARGTDRPVVGSPSQLPIVIAGTVTCSAGTQSVTQSAINVTLTEYVQGGGINPTLRLAKISELIMDQAGSIDASGLTINGVAANLVLGSATSFVIPSGPTISLTYVTQ